MREVNAEILLEDENISPANINSAKRKITEVMDLIRNRYVFSKVVREVVKHWRGRGLNKNIQDVFLPRVRHPNT
jgi:hypothetical protein